MHAISQFTAASRAEAFDHIVDSSHHISLRQVNWWNSKCRKTKSLHATLAIEMHMSIVVVLIVMTQAQLITRAITALERMNKVVVLKQSQSPEDATLVDSPYLVLQF